MRCNDKLNIDSEINIWDATSYYVKSGKVKAINFSEIRINAMI